MVNAYVPIVSPRLLDAAAINTLFGKPADCLPSLASRDGRNFQDALGIGL